MKKQKTPEIKLVCTIALEKELSKKWFSSYKIPVYTLAALKSGALSQPGSSHRGILIVVTGSGPEASNTAALWIREHLKPLYVVNMGTCGLTNQRYSLGEWLMPRHVANEHGEQLELDTRLPIPYPERISDIHSLLTVRKPNLDKFPETWQEHDAIDMECYEQAKVFQDTNISFHCLKFSTDYSDQKAFTDFKKNLELFIQKTKKLFNFVTTYDNHMHITVLVPVFNRQHAIQRAIDSIISQSYVPEEIIVVDDGSHDRTGEILKSYGDKVTCIFLHENTGPSRARNTGICHARTEWIAFMDSDDCWTRDKLKNQVEYLRTYPFYEIVQSEEVWIRNGVRVNPCKHHKKPFGWIWEQSLDRCLVSPSSVLVKKSLLERHGNFDEKLPVCEDYDLWLKISRYNPVGLDPCFSVIKYGGHKDQLSQKYAAMDRFRVTSLVRMLENESLPFFRRKIIHILQKKLKILLKGYEKRQKFKDTEECRVMLESLGNPR
jgi:glycosyltransferase involved in cell wall biosynthesis